MNDIDAFLRGDADPVSENTKTDSHCVIPPVARKRTAGAVDRLEARLTHIERSLTSARKNADGLNERLSNHAEDCQQFEADISDWETVIGDLEEAMPDHSPTDTQVEDDNLHDNIADAIASHLEDDSSARAARDHVETTVLPDDYKPLLAGDGASEQVEAPNDSDSERLLQFMEAQESRIRELETQLTDMKDKAVEQGTNADQPYVNRLVVAMNGTGNLKYPLTQNIMTIGREPHNDIHIRSRYVSRFHARIISDKEGSVVEDLDSRNGVAVNSQKVRRQRLRSGDLIDLGRIQLKYIDLMEGASGEGSA